MLNAEKYKEQIEEILNRNDGFAFGIAKDDGKIKSCRLITCMNCQFKECIIDRIKWLLSEAKIDFADSEGRDTTLKGDELLFRFELLEYLRGLIKQM